jgi:ribosomal protein S18 acetylase RimI-like enzyme
VDGGETPNAGGVPVTTVDSIQDGALATGAVTVRSLCADDLAAIVKIDRHSTGLVRHEYYEAKVHQAVAEQKLHVSLVAEVDAHVVGFLLARVYYGEFGQAESVAVADSMGVDPGFRRRGVGEALMHQLVLNLRALGVERLQPQVDWEQLDLLGFLCAHGFEPARRFCLERRID